MGESELIQQIEELKKTNKRIKWFMAFLVVFVWIAIVSSVHPNPGGGNTVGSTSNKIMAHEFDVVDDEGNTRMNLGFNLDKDPEIEIYDSQGRVRLGVGLDHSGYPHVGLLNADNKVRAAMLLSHSGSSTIAVYDNESNPVAIMGDGNGATAITVTNPQRSAFALMGFNDPDSDTPRIGVTKGDTVLWQAP